MSRAFLNALDEIAELDATIVVVPDDTAPLPARTALALRAFASNAERTDADLDDAAGCRGCVLGRHCVAA